MAGATCFTSLDLKAGFHNIPIDLRLPETYWDSDVGWRVLLRWVAVWSDEWACAFMAHGGHYCGEGGYSGCRVLSLDDIVVYGNDPV